MQGEEVLIQQNDHQVVRLVPQIYTNQKPQYGCAKGLIEMDDDFDAPLDDFKDYM
jgi:antitoxin (DNA-binding transcriptional repressor) of toxin-antitoxin stability system